MDEEDSKLRVYADLINSGNKAILMDNHVRQKLFNSNRQYSEDVFNLETLHTHLRYEFVRKLNVTQFAELFRLNLQAIKIPGTVGMPKYETIAFDDLVDLGILGILKLH